MNSRRSENSQEEHVEAAGRPQEVFRSFKEGLRIGRGAHLSQCFILARAVESFIMGVR